MTTETTTVSAAGAMHVATSATFDRLAGASSC